MRSSFQGQPSVHHRRRRTVMLTIYCSDADATHRAELRGRDVRPGADVTTRSGGARIRRVIDGIVATDLLLVATAAARLQGAEMRPVGVARIIDAWRRQYQWRGARTDARNHDEQHEGGGYRLAVHDDFASCAFMKATPCASGCSKSMCVARPQFVHSSCNASMCVKYTTMYLLLPHCEHANRSVC